jgi:hypothetical protein
MIVFGISGLALPVLSPAAEAREFDPYKEATGHHSYYYGGVAAVSPTSAFYAGHFGDLSRTRVKRWDGRSWSDDPGMARPHSHLSAVDAINPDDAWAVGSQARTGRPGSRPLIVHWNGIRWSVSHYGGLGQGFDMELTDISMVAPDDVWAAGFDLSQGGTVMTAIVLHWDGAAWHQVAVPDGALLNAVAATGPDDVWVAGYTFRSYEFLHWDGHEWSTAAAAGSILSMDALAPDDIWAGGVDTNGLTSGVIEHWDGKAWSVVPSPQPGGNLGTVVRGISAVSPDDVWAVGAQGNPPGGDPAPTLIEHWDGAEWSVVQSPSQGRAWSVLTDVSADSPSDAWAYGTFSNDASQPLVKLLFVHWDGTTWTRLHHLH